VGGDGSRAEEDAEGTELTLLYIYRNGGGGRRRREGK